MEIWRKVDQKIVINVDLSIFQVFIRELISNASDAIEKFRYLNMTGETLEQGGGYSYTIVLWSQGHTTGPNLLSVFSGSKLFYKLLSVNHCLFDLLALFFWTWMLVDW